MQSFLAALHQRPLLADGALGSYLFALTGRVSEQNHLYESFNLARPELVRQLHREYLQAGAQCLTSNSFAANATYPSAASIAELNATACAWHAKPLTNTANRTSAAIPCSSSAP